MANVFDIGDLVRVSAAFTDSAGMAAGTTTTLTYGVDAALVRDSAGNYHADISATDDGDWHYRWYSTGSGQASEEHWFRVRPQVVA